MIDIIEEILTLLNAAKSVQALNLPGYRLHPLKGDLKGHWAMVVNKNFRIIFRFENGSAYDVDFGDYH